MTKVSLRSNKPVYWFSYGVVKAWARVYLRLRVLGTANVPREGGLLVCSNHMSHLDPPIVGVAMPRMVFHMAKMELFKVPALRRFMQSIGTIIVDRGKGGQAVKDAVDNCQAGRAVVIFPEGTRSRDGKLKRGRMGAITIAVQAGVPIVPMALWGTDKAMRKGSALIRPGRVTVSIGEPYTVDYVASEERIPRDILERECLRMMEKIEALLPEECRPTAADKQEWYGALLAGHDAETTAAQDVAE